MKNIKLVVIWILAIIFGVGVAWLCFNQIPQSGFRDSFLGNLFATVIGVIAGIPIALWVSRVQQNNQENAEKVSKEREAKERAIKILRLVKKELEFDVNQLKKQAKGIAEFKEGFITTDGQKDELWNAFSDGGELQWINDLQLLDTISMAYYDIRRVMNLEKLVLEAKRPHNYVADLGILRGKWILEISPEVIQSVEFTLGEINKVIEDLQSKMEQN
jgi:hypothetical protein